jgi:S1-C subfamily serine protease
MPGDVVISLDGRAINNYDQLYHALDDHKIGDVVRLDTVRGSRKLSYRIKLIGAD